MSQPDDRAEVAELLQGQVDHRGNEFRSVRIMGHHAHRHCRGFLFRRGVIGQKNVHRAGNALGPPGRCFVFQFYHGYVC